MKISQLAGGALLVMAAAFAAPADAQNAAIQANPSPDFATLETVQNAANAKPGPRIVPGRSIPLPTTVSPELQTTIAAPYRLPAWDANPKSTVSGRSWSPDLQLLALLLSPRCGKSWASR